MLLWSAARRRYGRRAGFFAAALFAVLGPTLHLGAFATYKALSLFLVALAAWCVLRAGDQGALPGRMIAAGAALAVANATSYSTILFDLLVLALAALTAFPAPGGRVALRRVAIVLGTVIALLDAGLLIGGSSYFNGFKVTVLTPVAHTSSPLAVLSGTWYWAGILVILAVGGVIISAVRREGRPAPGRWPSWPPPRSWGWPSRPGCIPPRCSTSTWAWGPGSPPSPRATRRTCSPGPCPPGGNRR